MMHTHTCLQASVGGSKQTLGGVKRTFGGGVKVNVGWGGVSKRWVRLSKRWGGGGVQGWPAYEALPAHAENPFKNACLVPIFGMRVLMKHSLHMQQACFNYIPVSLIGMRVLIKHSAYSKRF